MAALIASGLFLSLYPLSVVLGAVHARTRLPVARFALLLLWPQLGVLLVNVGATPVPQWLVAWALATSGFYALRLLTVRELTRYAATFAASAAPLAWGLAGGGADTVSVSLFTLSLTLPIAMLNLLEGAISRRFGAAHASVSVGLASAAPRLATMLSLVVLAAAATPPFPGFFAMLALLTHLEWPASLAALGIWFIWGWAAAGLFKHLVAGLPRQDNVDDLSVSASWLSASVLTAMALATLYLAGPVG